MSKKWLVFSGCFLVLAGMMALLPLEALASTDLPFITPMNSLKTALSGPFAVAAAVIGIVAAGGTLIFGGDLNGFFRSMIFLVLVVCLVVLSNNFLTFIAGTTSSEGAIVLPVK